MPTPFGRMWKLRYAAMDAVSTVALLDLIGLPTTTGNGRRIAHTMRSLGFIPIKSRRLMPGGFRDTVTRGWARPVRELRNATLHHEVNTERKQATGMDTLNPPDAIHGNAIDLACEGDRVWFEQNPDRQHRLRDMMPFENNGPMELPPYGMTWKILVTQIKSGMRFRMLVAMSEDLPTDGRRQVTCRDFQKGSTAWDKKDFEGGRKRSEKK